MKITDPSILLANKGYYLPRRSHDGRVGAVVLEGEYFATTSNMDIIYAPPLRKKMTFKTNYRLGEDDPLQWPQFYMDGLPHYPCIPRKPDNLSEDYANYIMFHYITDSDFEHKSMSGLAGLGNLRNNLLIKARKFVHATVDPKYERVKDMAPVFPPLYLSIIRLLNHLESLPMTRRQVLFIFAEFQRQLLEFVAAFNYVTTYQHIMNGLTEPATAVDEVVGTFVTDVALCDKFVRAGIPVWLIRPASLAASVRIDALVDPLQPKDFLCLESAYHHYPVSYEGPPTDMKKYIIFGRYTRDFLSYGDVFDTAALQPKDRLVATAQKARFQPYKPPKKIPDGAGRNKFMDIVNPLLPPMHKSWGSALSLVKNTRTFSTELGYAFPEPSLFVAVGNDARRALYFHNWLKYRTLLLFRMMSAPYPLRGQLWRDLLSLPADVTLSSAQPSSSASASATKGAKRRELMKDMLQACLSRDSDLKLDQDSHEKAVWCDQTVKANEVPPPSMARQILWELSELNFRYELHVLDGHLHLQSGNDADLARDILISKCFPDHSMLLVDFKNSNRGLSSQDWRVRRPYVLALRDVIKTWAGWSFASPVNHESEESMLALEIALTRLYTQKFYDTFGRAATVPRCL